eukprot:6046188-Pleurochrysis_carterae.AAC.1
MSACLDSPTHIFDVHYPFPVPLMAEGNVEEIECIYKARLIMANKFMIPVAGTGNLHVEYTETG